MSIISSRTKEFNGEGISQLRRDKEIFGTTIYKTAYEEERKSMYSRCKEFTKEVNHWKRSKISETAIKVSESTRNECEKLKQNDKILGQFIKICDPIPDKIIKIQFDDKTSINIGKRNLMERLHYWTQKSALSLEENCVKSIELNGMYHSLMFQESLMETTRAFKRAVNARSDLVKATRMAAIVFKEMKKELVRCNEKKRSLSKNQQDGLTALSHIERVNETQKAFKKCVNEAKMSLKKTKKIKYERTKTIRTLPATLIHHHFPNLNLHN